MRRAVDHRLRPGPDPDGGDVPSAVNTLQIAVFPWGMNELLLGQMLGPGPGRKQEQQNDINEAVDAEHIGPSSALRLTR